MKFGRMIRHLAAGLLMTCTAWAASAAEPVKPSFALTDHKGQPVTEKSFRGRALLVYFGYTFCPDACPTDLQTVAASLDALGADADLAQGLFVSVDPGRDDKPGVMADYVSAFHPRLNGATGTRDQIDKAVGQFGARYFLGKPAADGSYQVGHTTKIALLDAEGHLIKSFPTGTAAQAIADAIRNARTLGRTP